MSWLAGLLVSAAGRGPAQRFDSACRTPELAQTARLIELCTRHAASEFGRTHNFSSVRSLKDFQARVPIQDYVDLRPDIQRMMLGETSVLVDEPVELFARTSGTAGEPKFIPSTRRCRTEDHAEQLRTWFHSALRAHPKLFHGAVLSMTSPAVEGVTPSGIPYGSVSGLMQRHMPRVVKRCYVIPEELTASTAHQDRWYALALLGLAADVTFLATANPSSILRLVETIDTRSDELLRDLKDRTLLGAPQLEAHVRTAVLQRLRGAGARVVELESMRRSRGGRLLPSDYWPHLQLIGCWKGGTVGGHVARFDPWFRGLDGSVPVRDWGWLSSECRGSIPLSDQGASGVLSVHKVVLEFVPAEELDRSQPETLPVQALETGREYGVIVSTSGGLWRYDMNDIVEVVGRHHETPCIVFRRKGRGMTSMTGEKLSVNQVILAVDRAARANGCTIDHWRVEADPDESRYILMAESKQGLPPMARGPLLRVFDLELRKLNLEYGAKRSSGRLHMPVLHVMRSGWYAAGRKAHADAGGRVFQAKTIVLRTRTTPDASEPEAIIQAEDDA
jgi:hypothetical protein